MTDNRKYHLNKSEMKKYFFVSYVSLAIVGMLFYQNIYIALILGLLSIPGKSIYENHLADKLRDSLRLQFKDLLYSFSSSFATGRQMPTALTEALDNLSAVYTDDAIIIKELKYMNRRIKEDRAGEEEILSDFALRSGIEDIENFVDVYFTCRDTGGNMEKVIREAGEVIIDKLNIEKEIETITSQKRFEARILTGIPLFLIAFLQLTSSDYISPLYCTVEGRILMTLALAMIMASFIWSMKIIKVRI